MAPAGAIETVDNVWRAQDTHPDAIEAALRHLLVDAHRADQSYTPARVLNLVCIVDKQYSGEIANRLRRVGRYHASRTVVCSVSPRQTTLDAVATIAAPGSGGPGQTTTGRETVVVEMGPRHLEHLDSIVDPLVVTDLTTVVWSPHGFHDAVRCLLGLAQIALIDSVDEDDPEEAIERAQALMEKVYVVDLAWLRSTPWRERVAATFDPARLRPELRTLSRVTVRHHPDSAIAGLLFLGWLGSRLDWRLSPMMKRDGALVGRATSRRQDVQLRLELDPTMQVRGLAGVELEAASGRWLRFDRGAGGLRAHYRGPKDAEREWTILGASRGEAGILGEGIRQALLRDHTYRPALLAAGRLVP